ncbi:MAG: hypothetical protein JSV33_09420 [bacterium]|nr:MAG: hypothetical protein JSV33_09420 [bacterium]
MMSTKSVKVLGVLAITILLLSLPALAETQFELSFGMDSPTGSLNEFWRVGFGINAGAFLEITPFTSAGLCIGYSRMSLDEEHLLEYISAPSDFTVEGNFSVISICGELRMSAGAMDKAIFFGGIGVGLFMADMPQIVDQFNYAVTTAFDWENKIGGYVNAGFAYPVSDMINIGLKAKYSIFSVGDDIGWANLETFRGWLTFQALAMISLM